MKMQYTYIYIYSVLVYLTIPAKLYYFTKLDFLKISWVPISISPTKLQRLKRCWTLLETTSRFGVC